MPYVKVVTLVSAGDMSASVTSDAFDLQTYTSASIQAVFTGSPVGTLKLQVSNDNVTYSDYTGSTSSVSAAGNFTWIVTSVPEHYIRMVYTRTSGTGSITATICAKGMTNN